MSIAVTRKPSRAPPVPHHHGDLRNELIRGARASLESSGLQEISLVALARQAGVSGAAPFKHFDSKESLLAVVATQGMQELVDLQIGVHARGLEALDALQAMLFNYIKYGRQNPGLYSLMFGPRFLDLGRYPELEAVGSKLFALFGDAVSAFALSSGWKLRDVELMTHTLWATQHGLVTLIIANRAPNRSSRIQTEEMVVFSIAEMIDSLAKGPPDRKRRRAAVNSSASRS